MHKAGAFILHPLNNKPIVVKHILHQQVHPFFTFIIGGYGGNHPERVDVTHLVDVYSTVDTAFQVWVYTYDIGDLKAGYIE